MVGLRASSLETRVGENFDVSLTPGDFIPIVGLLKYQRRTDSTYNQQTTTTKTIDRITVNTSLLGCYNIAIILGAFYLLS